MLPELSNTIGRWFVTQTLLPDLKTAQLFISFLSVHPKIEKTMKHKAAVKQPKPSRANGEWFILDNVSQLYIYTSYDLLGNIIFPLFVLSQILNIKRVVGALFSLSCLKSQQIHCILIKTNASYLDIQENLFCDIFLWNNLIKGNINKLRVA